MADHVMPLCSNPTTIAPTTIIPMMTTPTTANPATIDLLLIKKPVLDPERLLDITDPTCFYDRVTLPPNVTHIFFHLTPRVVQPANLHKLRPIMEATISHTLPDPLKPTSTLNYHTTLKAVSKGFIDLPSLNEWLRLAQLSLFSPTFRITLRATHIFRRLALDGLDTQFAEREPYGERCRKGLWVGCLFCFRGHRASPRLSAFSMVPLLFASMMNARLLDRLLLTDPVNWANYRAERRREGLEIYRELEREYLEDEEARAIERLHG